MKLDNQCQILNKTFPCKAHLCESSIVVNIVTNKNAESNKWT